MTCIIGIKSETELLLGADTLAVAGYNSTRRADTKIFRRGKMLMGFTDSYRMGQLLKYKLVIKDPPPGPQLFKWMCTTFIEAVRTCLKDGGYLKTTDNVDDGGTFIVGVHGRLFTIQDDFQVSETRTEYCSVGCGRYFAMGSLATSTGLLRNRLKKALQVAEKFSCGVGRPFTILSIKKPGA